MPFETGLENPLSWASMMGSCGRLATSNRSAGTKLLHGNARCPRVLATARHCLEGQQRFDISFGGSYCREPFSLISVETGHNPIVDAAILILNKTLLKAAGHQPPLTVKPQAIPRWYGGGSCGYGETYDRTRSGRYFAVVQLAALIVRGDRRRSGRQGLCFGDSGGPVAPYKTVNHQSFWVWNLGETELCWRGPSRTSRRHCPVDRLNDGIGRP